MKNYSLLILCIAFFILYTGCEKEDLIEKEEEEIKQINPRVIPYLGDYEIQYTQLGGHYTVYDSVGNPSKEERTEEIFTPNFKIELFNDGDTLRIDGILQYLYNRTTSTLAMIKNNNRLEIIHEKSDLYNRNFIRGTIWLKSDSLFLEYEWDTSYTYPGAGEYTFGSVIGKGVKKD